MTSMNENTKKGLFKNVKAKQVEFFKSAYNDLLEYVKEHCKDEYIVLKGCNGLDMCWDNPFETFDTYICAIGVVGEHLCILNVPKCWGSPDKEEIAEYWHKEKFLESLDFGVYRIEILMNICQNIEESVEKIG